VYHFYACEHKLTTPCILGIPHLPPRSPRRQRRGAHQVVRGYCYKQYTGIFKIDTEMTCYRQYTGVLKIDTEIASVLYIRVHSSRDRHCCIYKYISGRDQVEVSKTRSKSTTANNLCFRYSGGRSSSNASPEKQYKTRVGEPKALRPPDLEVARTTRSSIDVLSTT
jgi:hypothetical protein